MATRSSFAAAARYALRVVFRTPPATKPARASAAEMSRIVVEMTTSSPDNGRARRRTVTVLRAACSFGFGFFAVFLDVLGAFGLCLPILKIPDITGKMGSAGPGVFAATGQRNGGLRASCNWFVTVVFSSSLISFSLSLFLSRLPRLGQSLANLTRHAPLSWKSEQVAQWGLSRVRPLNCAKAVTL